MFRLVALSLLLASSSVAAFTHPSTKAASVSHHTSAALLATPNNNKHRAQATQLSLTKRSKSSPEILRAAETFSKLVNKNEQGYKQDLEEFSERLSLDISKTQYTQLVKSPPDAYISFAEKGASNAQ